jgi:fatty-acyl-CoA synthase
MAAGIAFPVNWMLEPRHMLHLIKEANAKAVIALGSTPGFKIWESMMSIAGDLALGTSTPVLMVTFCPTPISTRISAV